jgi:hypothetical protein
VQEKLCITLHLDLRLAEDQVSMLKSSQGLFNSPLPCSLNDTGRLEGAGVEYFLTSALVKFWQNGFLGAKVEKTML